MHVPLKPARKDELRLRAKGHEMKQDSMFASKQTCWSWALYGLDGAALG